ncbi:MAG: CsbD family protein [Trueperaceae bacterium]|nr:MAG: CsbD family protein [Trueperaceae bacterium]
MNEDTFKGKWKQLRGRAKQVWGDLSDDDLTRIDGSYDRLVGTLQEKYGYTKAEAQKKIDKEFGDA